MDYNSIEFDVHWVHTVVLVMKTKNINFDAPGEHEENAVIALYSSKFLCFPSQAKRKLQYFQEWKQSQLPLAFILPSSPFLPLLFISIDHPCVFVRSNIHITMKKVYYSAVSYRSRWNMCSSLAVAGEFWKIILCLCLCCPVFYIFESEHTWSFAAFCCGSIAISYCTFPSSNSTYCILK